MKVELILTVKLHQNPQEWNGAALFLCFLGMNL